jgi:hypothetical protein
MLQPVLGIRDILVRIRMRIRTSDKKSLRSQKAEEIKVFKNIFDRRWKDPGPELDQDPKGFGCGSWRTKNIRIQMRIRIPSTGYNMFFLLMSFSHLSIFCQASNRRMQERRSGPLQIYILLHIA